MIEYNIISIIAKSLSGTAEIALGIYIYLCIIDLNGYDTTH